MEFHNHDSRLRNFNLVLERDLEYFPQNSLPDGYHFTFFQEGDRDDWITIEQSAKVFDSYEEGLDAWKKYYYENENMLTERMVFIENEAGQKIATATAYFGEKDNSESGWLLWVAICREYQGRGLSKPLLTFTLNIMKDIGHTHVKVVTQTITWLACKTYLEFGFVPNQANMVESRDGWRMIRTLTNHPVLEDFERMRMEDMIDEKTKEETMKEDLPKQLKEIIGDRKYTRDTIGKSSSSVLIFDDMVLKIGEQNEESENECRMMKWLDGKLPVPKIIYEGYQEGTIYLLMSKVEGVISCEPSLWMNPDNATELLAKSLQMVWNVDISECPYHNSIDNRLKQARYNVEHNLVDVDDCEPETFCENGFKDPTDLLDWLIKNKPVEEPVLSHGDFCMPNIFFKDGKVSGYIDLGKCGISDKWQDIALCYRSLKHNTDGTYGVKCEQFSPDLLFDKLGITPDWDKMKYFKLLDELF